MMQLPRIALERGTLGLGPRRTAILLDHMGSAVRRDDTNLRLCHDFPLAFQSTPRPLEQSRNWDLAAVSDRPAPLHAAHRMRDARRHRQPSTTPWRRP